MDNQTLWLRRICLLILAIGLIGLPMIGIIGNSALGKAERIVVIVEQMKEGIAPAGRAMVDKTIDAVGEIDPTEIKDGFREIGGTIKEETGGWIKKTFRGQKEDNWWAKKNSLLTTFHI